MLWIRSDPRLNKNVYCPSESYCSSSMSRALRFHTSAVLFQVTKCSQTMPVRLAKLTITQNTFIVHQDVTRLLCCSMPCVRVCVCVHPQYIKALRFTYGWEEDTRQLLAGLSPSGGESVNVTAMCSMLAARELIQSSSHETMWLWVIERVRGCEWLRGSESEEKG